MDPSRPRHLRDNNWRVRRAETSANPANPGSEWIFVENPSGDPANEPNGSDSFHRIDVAKRLDEDTVLAQITTTSVIPRHNGFEDLSRQVQTMAEKVGDVTEAVKAITFNAASTADKVNVYDALNGGIGPQAFSRRNSNVQPVQHQLWRSSNDNSVLDGRVQSPGFQRDQTTSRRSHTSGSYELRQELQHSTPYSILLLAHRIDLGALAMSSRRDLEGRGLREYRVNGDDQLIAIPVHAIKRKSMLCA
jgi:hypothetical protein